MAACSPCRARVLFAGLRQLMQLLHNTAGTHTTTLAEETIVVVQSEMGRTPKLNATNGKDHWPYTSAMLMGAGIAGGQVIGGYDEFAIGQNVRLSDGAVSDAGTPLVSGHLGATLLALAGIDPGGLTGGLEPITAALR